MNTENFPAMQNQQFYENLNDSKNMEQESHINKWGVKILNYQKENMCYNPSYTKEDYNMSSMVVLNLEDSYIIASDSHSTQCNGETNRQYQKIFPFSNGVLGIIGVNNILFDGRNINIGDFIINQLIKEEDLTSDKLLNLMMNFYSKKGYDFVGNIELVFVFAENKTLHHEYYITTHNRLVHSNYIKLPEREVRTYGLNNIVFPKGNSEFLNEVNRNPIEVIKRVIRFNADVQLFMENNRYIGGAIQMYEINIDGEVKNLSEEPFNKQK